MATLPFMAVTWLIVWLSLRNRSRFSKKPALRTLQAFVIGIALLAVFASQLCVYSLITNEPDPPRDIGFLSILMIQSFVGIAITFGMLRNSKRAT
jgi:hypothetical protein